MIALMLALQCILENKGYITFKLSVWGHLAEAESARM